MTAEFSVIERFFSDKQNSLDVISGIGDDAAIFSFDKSERIVSSIDTMVAGVHFYEDTPPQDIAYKSLAISLSDLAAMGAKPHSVLLALTLPTVDEVWLQAFSDGFFACANQYSIYLAGGDTTQGPLSITTQVLGILSSEHVLLRSGAQEGDDIYVTGTLGDAAYALHSNDASVIHRLHRPTPRVEQGLEIVGIAHAAIDVSDGLVADLGHILKASNCGATIFVDQLPLSDALKVLPLSDALQFALAGGDDYELCFTAAPEQRVLLTSLGYCLIGGIEVEKGLRFIHDKKPVAFHLSGYQHFKG